MPTSIIRTLDQVPPGPHVVTVGSFDGVHRGHQYLVGQVIDDARAQDVGSVVITFDPLPPEVLRPDRAPKRVTTTADRLSLLVGCGVDTVVALPFDTDFAQLSAEEFVDRLVAATQPVEIIVGEDFAFGRNRSGNPALLEELGERHGFTVRVLSRSEGPAAGISSSRIREALSQGDISTTNQMLGRPFTIQQGVQEGERRGRDLGFPTANLEPAPNLALPADGIYAALASVGESDELRPAIVYIGTRPVFGGSKRIVEAHLLDFSADLYGQSLLVLFVERIREDQWFANADALVQQMKLDEKATRRILAGLPEGWPFDAAMKMLGIERGVRAGGH